MLFLNSYFIYSWRKIFIQTYLLNEKKNCPSGNHLSSHGGARFHSRFTQNLVTYTRFHTLARMIRLRINRRFTSLLGGTLQRSTRGSLCDVSCLCMRLDLCFNLSSNVARSDPVKLQSRLTMLLGCFMNDFKISNFNTTLEYIRLQ